MGCRTVASLRRIPEGTNTLIPQVHQRQSEVSSYHKSDFEEGVITNLGKEGPVPAYNQLLYVI